MFSCKFCEIFISTSYIEHLRETASGVPRVELLKWRSCHQHLGKSVRENIQSTLVDDSTFT